MPADNVPAESRSLALADEPFRLHFLEDSFAPRNVTGNWGNSAVSRVHRGVQRVLAS